MLVAAVMKLAGDANWWAPSFLKRRRLPPAPHDRYPVDPDWTARDLAEVH
jgi:hypothetical protein